MLYIIFLKIYIIYYLYLCIEIFIIYISKKETSTRCAHSLLYFTLDVMFRSRCSTFVLCLYLIFIFLLINVIFCHHLLPRIINDPQILRSSVTVCIYLTRVRSCRVVRVNSQCYRDIFKLRDSFYTHRELVTTGWR